MSDGVKQNRVERKKENGDSGKEMSLVAVGKKGAK